VAQLHFLEWRRGEVIVDLAAWEIIAAAASPCGI